MRLARNRCPVLCLAWSMEHRVQTLDRWPWRALTKGETLKATLNFEHARPVEVEFNVTGVGATGAGGMKGMEGMKM